MSFYLVAKFCIFIFQIDEMNSLKAKTSNLPGQDKPVVDQKTNWKEFRKKHGKLPDGHLIEFLGHLGSLDPEQVILELIVQCIVGCQDVN